MKVILCEDVINLGAMGETVKVADGYARNFLLPRNLAVSADSASAKEIDHQLRIIKKREAERREQLKDVAQKIAELTITIEMKAGEGGKLYGSVTNTMIAEQLQEAGHVIDRRNIKIDDPIKALGDYEVTLKLGSGVDAPLKVVVEADQTVTEEDERAAAELDAAAADDAAHEAEEAAERAGGYDDDDDTPAAAAEEKAEA